MPKTIYCWRCGADIPMLDEQEWESVMPHLRNMIARIKRYRLQHNVGLAEANARAHDDALDRYFEITGRRELNPGAIWHHRLSKYGPSCASCGKPLRTPRAKFCAACGAPREAT